MFDPLGFWWDAFSSLEKKFFNTISVVAFKSPFLKRESWYASSALSSLVFLYVVLKGESFCSTSPSCCTAGGGGGTDSSFFEHTWEKEDKKRELYYLLFFFFFFFLFLVYLRIMWLVNSSVRMNELFSEERRRWVIGIPEYCRLWEMGFFLLWFGSVVKNGGNIDFFSAPFYTFFFFVKSSFLLGITITILWEYILSSVIKKKGPQKVWCQIFSGWLCGGAPEIYGDLVHMLFSFAGGVGGWKK